MTRYAHRRGRACPVLLTFELVSAGDRKGYPYDMIHDVIQEVMASFHATVLDCGREGRGGREQ